MSSKRVPIAILLSGRGSNLLALHAAIERGEVPARIVLVASNEPEAPGLAKAREVGLPTAAVPHRGVGGRAAHERSLLAALEAAGPEWICLAGYMRLLSAGFISRYRWRILNVHPSLLPAFPGLDAQRQALDYGVRVAGCTVHLVDEGLDSGPIVDQRHVRVLDTDTPEDLAARVLAEEHLAYPAALRRLLVEQWEVHGRRLVFGES